jgi:hypothetical protein
MQEWVEDYVGEMQQSLKGRSSTVGRENALSVRCALPSTEKMRTLASLSAARCAYMFGCSDTLAMLLACGNEERPLDKLGRATSLSAGARRELDCWSEVMAKDKAREDSKETRKKATMAAAFGRVQKPFDGEWGEMLSVGLIITLSGFHFPRDAAVQSHQVGSLLSSGKVKAIPMLLSQIVLIGMCISLDLLTMKGVHDPYFRSHWINFNSVCER